jgi:hypothetical protein
VAVVWLLAATTADVDTATAYAEPLGYTVATWPTDTLDPLGDARRHVEALYRAKNAQLLSYPTNPPPIEP